METLYGIAGIPRQAFHQWMKPSRAAMERTPDDMVLDLAKHVRHHYLPGFSARMIYEFIRKKPEYSERLKGWGKHRFEQLCLHNGLRIITPRSFIKTTQRGDFVFDNLIAGMEIDDINQIWVSDICYVFNHSHQLIGYATTLMDVYSRYLLGLSFSQTMRAIETSQAVIDEALAKRGIPKYHNLIFHSDGGKQYIETNFIKTLRAAGIRSSMADNALENGFAESLNDVLKNSYIVGIHVNSFKQLQDNREFIMYSYNHYKPHSGLKGWTPFEFEQQLKTLQPFQRTKLLIKHVENVDK